MRSFGARQPKIELERVCMDFTGRTGSLSVLKEIDLVAQEGEFVSLLGPRGCGKSTLLNIISGLQEPTSGSIRFDGRPATS